VARVILVIHQIVTVVERDFLTGADVGSPEKFVLFVG